MKRWLISFLVLAATTLGASLPANAASGSVVFPDGSSLTFVPFSLSDPQVVYIAGSPVAAPIVITFYCEYEDTGIGRAYYSTVEASGRGSDGRSYWLKAVGSLPGAWEVGITSSRPLKWDNLCGADAVDLTPVSGAFLTV